MPKISVIIPVYNVEKYLEECLNSVINQTLQDIEIICIDDGSTDHSLDILKEYAKKDNRITIMTQQNKGAGTARNCGVDNAHGQYLYFLDSDDYIDLDLLKKMSQKADELQADICICKEQKFDMSDNSFIKCDWSLKTDFIPNHSPTFSHKTIPNNILQVTVPNLFIKLFRKSFISKNNLRFQEIKTCNDVFFSLGAMSLADSICYIDEVLAVYRTNHTNCLTKNRGNSANCIIMAYKKLKDKLIEKGIFNNISESYYKAMKTNVISELRYTSGYDTINLISLTDKILPKEHLLNILKTYNYKFKKHFKFITTAKIESKNYLLIGKSIHFSTTRSLQDIFSLQNEGIHKVITILGLKLKIKSKKVKNKRDSEKRAKILRNLVSTVKTLSSENTALREYVEFMTNNVKENSILMVEPNNFHSEVLAGIIQYFLDMGFNIDVLISPKEFAQEPFSEIKSDNFRVFPVSQLGSQYIINSNFVADNYKYLYINSDMVYNKNCMAMEFYKNTKLPHNRIIQMCHRLEYSNKELYSNVNLLSLADLPQNNGLTYNIVNAHRFTNHIKNYKNKETNFIIVGNINKSRKNYDLLIGTIKDLIEQGIQDFKVTVIARVGVIDLPEEIKSKIDFKGSLNYPEMFSQMRNADFFLTLLDPENIEHDRYIKDGTSGSFQLIYGFGVPGIIANKFAQKHFFSNENSILYEKNSDLAEAMKKAIIMTNDQYIDMQNNLINTTQKIREMSYYNLKQICEAKEPCLK